jgi:hypothetical protein
MASARTDLADAKADAKSATGSSRASLDVAQEELAEARLALDGATHELLMRNKELKLARTDGSRTGVIGAKALVAQARGAVAEAEGAVSRAERHVASIDLAGKGLRSRAGVGVADARAALTEDRAPSEERAQLEALAAAAEVDAARLELERATFANAAGAGLDIQPYEDALAAAQGAFALATGRLPQPGPPAGGASAEALGTAPVAQ